MRRPCAYGLAWGTLRRMSRGLELALVFATTLVVSFGVLVHARLKQRRAVQARLDAARSFAVALRDALAFDTTLKPADEPFREGMWALDGVLHGRPLRALVGVGGVLLAVQLPGPAGAGWELVPTQEFQTRGGSYNDPADPHRPLDPAALGAGWSVRGHDAERKIGALSPAIRALLRADVAAPPWVLGGWMRVHHAGDDVAALAAWIHELTGRIAAP